MSTRRSGILLGLLGSVLLAPVPTVCAIEPEPFMRVVEEGDGLRSSLQTAIRTYQPRHGDGPIVHLVAAVHIGDASFYHQLQEILDAQDLVLFEGVGEHDVVGPAASTDQLRARVSRARAGLLASVLAKRSDAGEPIDSLAELASDDEAHGALLEGMMRDAWGRPMVLGSVADPHGGTMRYIASLGADGVAGGEGVDADIIVSPSYLPPPPEAGPRGAGIQQQLADALGLTFQLSGMSSEHPNWRNADLTVDQVMARMEEVGAQDEGEMLFKTLSGEGLMGKLAGFALKLVGSSPTMQETIKMVLIDTLVRADELMAIQPGAMAKLMDVILEDRNRVVLDEVEQVIEHEPAVRSLGVIYGAGHLAALERALVDELGYEPSGTVWVTAMRADLESVGVSPRQAHRLRSMVRRSLDAQLRRASKAYH